MVALVPRAVLLTALVSMLFGCGINNIPTFSEAVNLAWSEVQFQYKRRADLVPALLDVLHPMATQNQAALQALSHARDTVEQTYVSPETLNDKEAFNLFEQNQISFSRVLDGVFTLGDERAEVSQTDAYQSLKTEFANIENRITVARRDYIQKVERYNSELDSVPGRWWRAFMYSDAHKHATFDSFDERESLQQRLQRND